MLNQNFPEGKLIQQVLKRIHEDRERNALSQITQFLQYFLDTLVKSHKISKEDWPTLRLYISRLIFPLIVEKSFGEAQLINREADIQFVRNQKVKYIFSSSSHHL
jgi:hypothetical protein